jgi:Pectate lyase superfamily protein
LTGTQRTVRGRGTPSTARRNVLTGGAVGLAALAGSAFGGLPQASAQTPPPSITDWLNITSYGAVSGTVSQTQATANTTAINTALADAGALPAGGVVYVPAGIFQIDGPLFVPAKVTLRGAVPVAPNWSSATEAGSVLKVVSFQPNAAFPLQSIIFMSGRTITYQGVTYTGGARMVIEDLWIDASSLPPGSGTSGIGATYSAFNGIIRNVGLYQIPSDGIQFTSTDDAQPDGWLLESVMIEAPGGNGVTLTAHDTLMIGVHVQNGTGGDGFYLSDADNGRLIGCRADSCTNGFTFPAGNGATLIGCGTEGNARYGLNVQNSNTTPGSPIRCSGCSFTFDTVSGIYVSGLNIVLLEQCNVLVGQGYNVPAYALTVAEQNGQSPILVQAMGGVWNCQNTASAISVGSGVNANKLSYSVHEILGGTITATSTAQILQSHQL